MKKQDDLLGTRWKHKRNGGMYLVTKLSPECDNVYLQAKTKGCRSTWKFVGLLPWDYEQVKENQRVKE